MGENIAASKMAGTMPNQPEKGSIIGQLERQDKVITILFDEVESLERRLTTISRDTPSNPETAAKEPSEPSEMARTISLQNGRIMNLVGRIREMREKLEI